MEDLKTNRHIERDRQTDRLHIMDSLRGIALLGIFLANIYYFSGIAFLNEAAKEAFPTATIDHWLHFLQSLFIEGKFYSIFSLLFGAGFGLMLHNAKKYGVSFKKYYFKRLSILFGIGAIHLFLIWPGDILTLYALLGFLMIFFINVEEKALWIWAFAFLMSPLFIFLIIYFSGVDPGILLWTTGRWLKLKLFPATDVSIFQIIASGSLLDVLKINMIEGFGRWGYLLYSSRLPKVFGMFLIGFIFIKKGIFKNPAQHKDFLKAAFWTGLALGLPGSLTIAIIPEETIFDLSNTMGIWHTLAYSIGVHSLAIGYTAGIILLSLKLRYQNFIRFFAPAGKMALSNYLMQTATGIFIFYGVGLGFAGYYGYTITSILAVVIFIAQVFISRIWLTHYYYGPAEWFWRSLLLSKPQKFKKPNVGIPVQPAI